MSLIGDGSLVCPGSSLGLVLARTIPVAARTRTILIAARNRTILIAARIQAIEVLARHRAILVLARSGASLVAAGARCARCFGCAPRLAMEHI